MLNVGIVGMGYVGLTLSIAAAKAGHKIYGVEKNELILNSLNEGIPHFYEKGIQESLNNVINNNLFINDRFQNGIDFDCFVITVGTPLHDESKKPDIKYIYQALDGISDFYSGKELVILRSTVSVGVTRNYVINYLSKLANIEEDDVLVSFCPERTVEGDALNELEKLPQIIGSNNEEAFKITENFFRVITSTILRVESLEAAELVKLFNNTYRDIHFSIGNYFNEIAQSFGINGMDLIKAANYQYQRSNIASPGFVGGPCLEKDSYILVDNLKDSKGRDFVLGARRYNESMEDVLIEWLRHQIKKNNISKIGFTGLAFKGNPDNSDLRGSSAINIVNKLKKIDFKEIELSLHDFVVPKNELEAYGKSYDDIFKLANESEIVIILNNNYRYKSLHIDDLVKSMRKPNLILDCWACLDIMDKSKYPNILTLGDIYLSNEN
tara:strand:+ start:4787 stop:6103 length:1317 start_codon:yes stop_codon:yes gene_type:complete